MAVLRWVVGFMVIIMFLTYLFGQEDPNFPQDAAPSQEQPAKKKSLIGSIFKSITGEDVLVPPPTGNEFLVDESALNSDEALLRNTRPAAPTPQVPTPATGAKSFAVGELPRVPRLEGEATSTPSPLLNSAAQPAASPALSDDMLESVLRDMQAEGLDESVPAPMPVSPEMAAEEAVPNIVPFTPKPVEKPVLKTLSETGLPMNLWQGTPSDTVLSLLSKIEPTPYSSPVVVNIMERLMLSEVTPPAGIDAKRWKIVRAETLLNQGLVGAATTLVEQMASKNDVPVDAGIPELWVKTRLLQGDTSVCTYVQEMLPNVDTMFWKHALWTCQAMKSDKTGLKLSLDIVKKKDDESDVFMLLKDYLAAEEGEVFPMLDSGRQWSPLSQALLAQYPTRLTMSHVDMLSDVTLRTVASNTRAPMDMRLYSAERLVNSYGKTVDGLLLLQLYEAQQFDDEMMKHALQRVGEDVSGSQARALLWQAAEKERLSSERALILKKLWSEAVRDGLERLSVVLSPDKRRIQPDVRLAWFAPHVIQSSLNSGNVALARQWMTVLKGNETLSQTIKQQRSDVTVLFNVMDGQMTPTEAAEWSASVSTMREEDVVRILTLLEALGVSVDESVWMKFENVMDADVYTEETGALWLRLLGSSLNSGRVGESMLRALIPLSKRSPELLGTNTLANVTSALRLIGMQNDARALFVSAAIAEMKLQ